MGKMPAGLRRYWAMHGRGRKRTVRYTTKKKYGRRGGGRTFPLMLVPVGAVSASGFLLDKKLGSANIEYLKTGNYPVLAEGMLKSAMDGKNYAPMITAVALYVIARKLFGKVRLTKKLSLL